MPMIPTTAHLDDNDQHRVSTLIRGDATGGRLALLEVTTPAGQAPPTHLHANEEEIVYVLEGRLTFSVGDETYPAGAGDCLVLPRGMKHGYVVESGCVRLLVMLVPAGSEGLHEEMGRSPATMDIERLICVAAHYGITITGPSPG